MQNTILIDTFLHVLVMTAGLVFAIQAITALNRWWRSDRSIKKIGLGLVITIAGSAALTAFLHGLYLVFSTAPTGS